MTFSAASQGREIVLDLHTHAGIVRRRRTGDTRGDSRVLGSGPAITAALGMCRHHRGKSAGQAADRFWFGSHDDGGASVDAGCSLSQVAPNGAEGRQGGYAT